MKLKIILLCLTALCFKANAQENNYDVSLIPKNLLPYASAVVRNEQVDIEVKDLDNTIYHVKEAITILNKNGDDMAHVVLGYNNSEYVKYIKGTIYDEFGKSEGKFSESNFETVNYDDGFSLFQDVKLKHYEPSVTSYPYTVEYEYEMRFKQTLFFPNWIINEESATSSIENASYTFTCKPDFNIRYKEINMPATAAITTGKDGSKIYTWQVSGLKAAKHEPYSPIGEKYLSMVKIAPEKFEYEGIKGEFTNWNELGKWIYDKLLTGRQQVSPETIQYIQQLTAGISDPQIKAKKIYEYVQGKTHYVSVQIGIGGFQPFTAGDVDRLNYGDCKALVNYTQALLKVAGIDSWYCIVKSGDKKISMLNDFASMDQGDHIILCIPFKNDTTWADCTSQTIPFGYLGTFTDDRTVLACTPEGGKLLHTPVYSPVINLQQRKANFNINDVGALVGDITTVFKGIDYEYRDGIISQSPKEQFKTMQFVYSGVNNMAIEKLSFIQDKSLDPTTTENIKLKAPEFASINTNKIYFLLNPVDRLYQDDVPRQVNNRINTVYINDGYTDEDAITYTIPAGYHLYSNPLNLYINKPFGHFSATMEIDGNQLVYKRKLELLNGTYAKDNYQDLVDFFQSVADADEYNVSLAKN